MNHSYYGGGEYPPSSSSSSSDDDEGHDDGFPSSSSSPSDPHPSAASYGGTPRTRSRIVIHLDVDAFYCQTHELADPTLASRPFAVGQKHIIVTCNYVARSKGVRKLMLRSEARRACSDLVILEGSDIRPYRIQSARIYSAFREAVADLQGRRTLHGNAARRGGMDEMYADITSAVDSASGHCGDFGREAGGDVEFDGCYVFGESSGKHTEQKGGISMSEDQSGVTVRVAVPVEAGGGNKASRRRLGIAANIALTVKQRIRRDTGFTACVGISTSPMLAKFASDLRKPNSVNVLPPWHAEAFVAALPLRRVPGLGSRTMRRLSSLLEEYNPGAAASAVGVGQPKICWTCKHFMRVPRTALARLVGQVFSAALLNEITQKCSGVDPTGIIDDGGGSARTVSVEDSYRRGSVVTIEAVEGRLELLYPRLSLLLDDRRRQSTSVSASVSLDRSDASYPTTIRLTARLVDPGLIAEKVNEGDGRRRRPYRTTSRQCEFAAGKRLMLTVDPKERSKILREAVLKLAGKVLPQEDGARATSLDVTRLSIAVTNFSGLDAGNGGEEAAPKAAQTSMRSFFSPPKAKRHRQEQRTHPSSNGTTDKDRASSLGTTSNPFPAIGAPSTLPNPKLKKKEELHQIDPAVLEALPPEIAAEVASQYGMQLSALSERHPKKGKIDSYFRR